VLTTLGALVAALKLKILLRTTLASFYAPDPTTGHCATNAVDQLFQDSLFESLSAAAELKALLLSRVDMPMNIQNALVDVPNEMTNRYLWLSAFNPPSEAQPFEATCPLENGSLKVKGYYVAPGFGFISDGDFDLNQVASSYGWTTAFLLLAARRVQAHNRLWFHGPIPWINGKAVPLENSVYYLMSPGESDVSKAVAGPFSGEGDPAVYQFFIDRGAAFAGYSPASSPSYHEDWLTMQTAAVSLQALLKELPPQTPANDVVIADWGADPPPPNSKWTKGWPVQYAISYQSSNGPSLRSQWGAAMDTQGRWKPMLRHVGPSPDPSWQIQIWRQFVTGDPENANGVPIIVSTVDGTATTFEDDDPALVES
jgi:hypothetical protein